MTTKGISIEVPVPTYDDAYNLVQGVLAGLNMDRANQFRMLGAMDKLSDAVRIAKQDELKNAEPETQEDHE